MNIKKKIILLVIDGLGIGAMEDVVCQRPKDIGANSLKNILQQDPKLKLPFLTKIGFRELLKDHFGGRVFQDFKIALGKNRLMHEGADTFWGHQEIAGSLPLKPQKQFVFQKKEDLSRNLTKAGYRVDFQNEIIMVDDQIGIANNIEADLGMSINVIGSLDFINFKKILKIGNLVRQTVECSRVIVMGGKDITAGKILDCIELRQDLDLQVSGINIPKLNIYNEHYQVVHLGFDVEADVQIPTILAKNGKKVALIGKVADVIRCEGAIYRPMVYTDGVFDLILDSMHQINDGLIFANIQEIDLAGHREDTLRSAQLLRLIDLRLPEIINQLLPDDLLFITADHGNDPTIGHSKHTRELTPLVAIGKKIRPANLGVRETLSDMAATVCDYFGCLPPQNGTSFFKQLQNIRC